MNKVKVLSGWSEADVSLIKCDCPWTSDSNRIADLLYLISAQEELNLFAIADSAKNESLFQYLHLNDCQYSALYQGEELQRHYGISPFLIKCVEGSSLVDWLMTDAWSNQCAIFLTAGASFEDIKRHLMKFLRLEGDEQNRLFFRFFDPSILRQYLRSCTSDELSIFYGSIHSFLIPGSSNEEILIFENPNPELESLRPASRGGEETVFKLRDEQLAALLQHRRMSFISRMCVHLREVFPDPCAAMPVIGLEETIEYGIRSAKQYDFTSEVNVCKFIDIMCVFGREFDKDERHPWAREVLSSPDFKSSNERMKKLEELAVHAAFFEIRRTTELL